MDESLRRYRVPAALERREQRAVFGDIEQYYVKLLTAWAWPGGLDALRASGGAERGAYELARETLAQFDVVLAREQLADPRAGAALCAALRLDSCGASDEPPATAPPSATDRRTPPPNKQQRERCIIAPVLTQNSRGEGGGEGGGGSAADGGDGARAEDLERLRGHNRWDVALYEHARERGEALLLAAEPELGGGGGEPRPAGCGGCAAPGPDVRMPRPDFELNAAVPRCDGGWF